MARLLVLLAWIASGLAWAQAPSPGDIRRSGAVLADMDTGSFIREHPDLRFRHLGMDAYREGRKREAFENFRLASRYADKASQALIALMYWTGDGVPRDRGRAYAWIELAASRGYPELQRQRDLYWMQMTDEERTEARDLRQTLDGDYGDEAGMRRLTVELGSIRSAVTGSHLGWVGSGVVIYADSASQAAAGQSVAGLLSGSASGQDMSIANDSKRLTTADYMRMKDLQWQVQMQGHVEVGDPQPVAKPAADEPKRPG